MTQVKQERALRTRAAIIRAAAEVFDEFGFNGASMNKIIKRAGVTMGAMYFHFESKEALARSVMAEQAADVEVVAGEDGLQHLVDISMGLAYQLQRNVLLRAGVRLAVEQGSFGLRDSLPYELWIERFTEQLAAACRRGELLPHVVEEEFARVLVGAYSGTQLLSQITTGRKDLPERVASLWRFLLPGIAPGSVIAALRVDTAEPETASLETAG